MKYKEALQKRGLSVDSLSKALQKKIKDLDAQVTMYAELNENDELTESDLEDAKVIKNVIDELDKYVAHKVNIFDQAKYDAKLANVNKAISARGTLKKTKEVKKKVELPIEQVTKQEVVEQKVESENNVVEQPIVNYEQNVADGGEIEQEEFDKVEEVKPKKPSTGLILMGLGAFFLTWGAVNFFRSRR